MRNTPKDVIGRSSQVRIGRMKVVQALRGDKTTFIFDAQSNAITDKTFYDLSIEFFSETIQGMEGAPVYHMPSGDAGCIVSCECPYFLFNCEYALAKAGNAVITYSNGRPSYITNKAQFGKFLPYLCKHLYRAAPVALKAARDKAQTYKKSDFVD
jgi:hypothetical protein